MRYALGEIVLVVVGILMALQINNWNNQKIDNNTKNEILNTLLKNLDEDKISLQNHANWDSLRAISANLMLDALNERPIQYSVEDLRKLDIHYFYRKNIGQIITGNWEVDFTHFLKHVLAVDLSFQPRDMTYKMLIQGNNGSLIENKNLINSISSYYNAVYYRNRGENTQRDNYTYVFKQYISSDSRLTDDFEFLKKRKINIENWVKEIEKDASWQKFSYIRLGKELIALQSKIKKELSE